MLGALRARKVSSVRTGGNAPAADRGARRRAERHSGAHGGPRARCSAPCRCRDCARPTRAVARFADDAEGIDADRRAAANRRHAAVQGSTGRRSTGTLAKAVFEAGACLLGKTNIPVALGDWQADSPIYGRTNNPWDLKRTPGGSTGGGSAALAAGMTPLEIGSDIGGSIRVPGAYCGVYGHRPSETAIPREGSFPMADLPNAAGLMGVQGPLARSADRSRTVVRRHGRAVHRRRRGLETRVARVARRSVEGFSRCGDAANAVGESLHRRCRARWRNWRSFFPNEALKSRRRCRQSRLRTILP